MKLLTLSRALTAGICSDIQKKNKKNTCNSKIFMIHYQLVLRSSEKLERALSLL